MVYRAGHLDAGADKGGGRWFAVFRGRVQPLWQHHQPGGHAVGRLSAKATPPFGVRLFSRRERWGLTLAGWLGVAIMAGGVILSMTPRIHGFMAGDQPVRGRILVVEGWIPDYAISGAVAEFRQHAYKKVIAVGGPILLGSHLSGFGSYAELANVRLQSLGIAEDEVVVLETGDIRKDRTFQSAVAVKRWAALHDADLDGLDVYTLGVHARRSRLLFQKAFGDGVSVGVIAASDRSYDPDDWWKTSNGTRTVIAELIAYVYAALFFREEGRGPNGRLRPSGGADNFCARTVSQGIHD